MSQRGREREELSVESADKSKEKDKILKGFQKNKSEQSKSKLIQASDGRMLAATEELKILQSQLEIKEKIKIELPKTEVPKQKMVLKIENLDFAYPNQERLFHHFNLIITGPERLAIQGDNGSGKSSLAKIIMQTLIPQQGSIYLGVNQIQYLSQFSDFIDEELSILDNFLIKNPDLSTQEAYARLAQFNFRNIQAQKIIKHLSGGEKIRAGLAASLLSNHPPQLLILDEPNNHLDIESLEAIADILKLYQGALIVISHDEIFLNQINIQRIISLKNIF
jgi:ATPase subunit of ABC transporter with duplicated ATPase domains